MTTVESTVVYTDHVETITCVRTVACDDWRAAIELCGEFDMSNAAELRAELDEHLAHGRRVLRVDASAVSFMDSTAIGVLVAATQRCRAEHGSLILTGVPARMQRLLTIAGLDQLLLVDTAER